jgi:type III restriction enzyme
MKLHFEPNLDFQLQAIEAVCDLFRGQEICRTEFTVTMKRDVDVEGEMFPATEQMNRDLGLGNRLSLQDEEILANLRDVQLRNGLRQSESLSSGDFTVEMETGTGKTYVYLRTIFELNKRYGFSKFVIVVPSVAIKEGVYKSLQITEEHFRALYAGTPCDYFLYDSAKLGQVRNFATSSHVQIMVVTVGAINKKDVNNLYKDSEKTGGEKPIDLIRATRPILIVDEPQSVDGGLKGAGKEALDAMNPLCTLRYSATHVDKHHMVYRLHAVDAYERKLVKQIEVASATIEDAYNRPYVRLVSVSNVRNRITAKLEVDVQEPAGVRRQEVLVQDGDDLQLTTSRDIYANCRIGEINTKRGQEFLELRVPEDEIILRPGMAWGDVDPSLVQREMIRRTIREHLDKEKRLRPQGIKVLSLFFIDHVAKYRLVGEGGQMEKGEYARIFEEEYRRAAKLPDYATLFQEVDLSRAAEEVHDGYFSIDKRGGWSDTEENNAGNRENAERAYNLIMKDKERLLSLDTPLKFIFSHSALKEGWDNPNVFQICVLRDIRTERERRQTVGRGLRLCVNQEGRRLHGFEWNTLTVIALESYEDFAKKLQQEIEEDTGFRFGVVESHLFAALPIVGPDGVVHPLGQEGSEALCQHLRTNGYLDAKGHVLDSLRTAIKNNTIHLPTELEASREGITGSLRRLAGKLEIRNADERRTVSTRQAVLHSPEFKELWERIKHKTTYRVHFDAEKLIEDCTRDLHEAPPVSRTRLVWRTADLAIGKAGVDAQERATSAPIALNEEDIELPDLLTDLQDRTQLTRRSIHRILLGSDRLPDFLRNPQEFIKLTADIINRRKRLALVDGIKYQRLGDEAYYAQELFETEELSGYLKNMLAVNKSVHEFVVYDSPLVERGFAEDLEKNEAIKVYAKLPGWFKISTPLGSYNPDWAVLVELDGVERLFFVVETKCDQFPDTYRAKEMAKIECGKAHFKALAVHEKPVQYAVTSKLGDLLSRVPETD